MNDLLKAAWEICEFCKHQNWKFCIIGGLAVQRWGEPRATLDADLTLLAPWGGEEIYVHTILEKFPSRIANGEEFALQNRVLLVRSSNGRDIDISLGALPFEIEMIARAVQIEFAPKIVMNCCTAEDLFIMKVFAGRARDWIDAESIVQRQSDLDKNYIMQHLEALAEIKDSSEMLKRANQLLRGSP